MSNFDDEPDEPEPLTPQIRKRPMLYAMADDERDSRRAPTVDGRAQKRVMAPPLGVPIVRTKSNLDVTDACEMLEREPDTEVRAVVQRSRRNSGDPATVDDLAKVFVALYKERSANAERNAATEAVLQGPHKAHRATRRHLIATVVAAAIAAGAAVKPLIAPAAPAPSVDSGEAVRVDELRKSVDRLDIELREIRAALGLGVRK